MTDTDLTLDRERHESDRERHDILTPGSKCHDTLTPDSEILKMKEMRKMDEPPFMSASDFEE